MRFYSNHPSLPQAFVAAALTLASLGACGTAPDVPNDGQIYIGAHIDSSLPAAGSTGLSGQDTPKDFNSRMGFSASVFGLTQTIPLDRYNATHNTGGQANETLIELTGTSAQVFLTVRPEGFSFSDIKDEDYQDLAKTLTTWMNPPYNRRVFLRFAPDMNSPDTVYGMQPTAFVTEWKRMAGIIRSAAPGVSLVWSPKSSEGYPWGATLGVVQTQSDWAVLDTNHNNQLDHTDDAYAPYYPGDDQIDWAGLSILYKGASDPLIRSAIAPPAGAPGGALTEFSTLELDGFPGWSYTDFYNNYCQKHPCAISEFGAAWKANTTASPNDDQNTVQSAWWGGWANQTFLSTFPKIKLINLYEYSQVEDVSDLRDYRVSADRTIRQNFLQAWSAVAGSFIQAAKQDIPSDFSGSSPSGAALSGANSSSASGFPAQQVSDNVFSNSAITGRFEINTGLAMGLASTFFAVCFGGMIGLRA